MKKLLAGLLLVFALCSVILPNNVAYADESNCTINVTVSDLLGEFEGEMTLYLRTPNEEQNLKYSNHVYGKKTFITQDYGSSAVFGVSDIEGWTLVDANTLQIPQSFDTEQGKTVDIELYVFPSADNEEYGEYVEMLENDNFLVSDVLTQLGINTETPSNTVSTNVRSDFDFESWHDEAMQAYDKFASLFYSVQDDDSWNMILSMANARRNVSAKSYLRNVSNAKQSDWDNYSAVDIYLWHDTYLVFCDMMNKGSDYFDSKFNSGEIYFNQFYSNDIGMDSWTGTKGEELKEAYKNLVSYQVTYYNNYNYPYNFINDKSYADEIGVTQKEETKEEIQDLTDDDIKDLEEVADEIEKDEEEGVVKKSANNWVNVLDRLKKSAFSIGLLAVVVIAYLIVRHNVKKKNFDDMSDDGK